MSLWTWLLIAVGAFIVVYIAINLGSPKDDGIFILNGAQPGDKKTSSTMMIPRSFNEKEGAVFSWLGWILIKDFNAGFGVRRRIFSKGDCPGVYIDSTSNSLIVVINTFGSTPETILVPNIPASPKCIGRNQENKGPAGLSDLCLHDGRECLCKRDAQWE
jgi:hypothetical protein